jgi:flagellar L-ring protein precursor FlgH
MMRGICGFRRALWAVALVALCAGCATRKTFQTPRLENDVEQLTQDLELLPPFPQPAVDAGSLWTDAGPGASLVRDPRAFRINDLVTIVLTESSTGSNQSSTDLLRSSSLSIEAPVVLGNTDSNDVLRTDFESGSDFVGDGQTARRSQLNATLTARVLRVLPNGDLVVAGQKTVMVNREKQILTLVGSVRPADITSSNRISSSSVGELTVRMWGAGEVDDNVRQGWLMRVVAKIWPF